MSNENIFSALAKYNSATDENYLTESLVFVINALLQLQQERHVGIEILTQLCVKDNEFSFDIDEDISVSTQETTEQGTPDIKVSSPDKLMYIEVKDYSPVDPEQLRRYKKALESSSAAIKRLILLTRFPVDFSEHRGIPDKHVRWFEVYNWLSNARTKVKDPISIYLIGSFKSFLEAKQMTIQKVGWEYINGVQALNNLINMIEVAIQRMSLRTSRGGSGREYRGYDFKDGEFWCGISYDKPMVVMFEIKNKEKFDSKLVDESSYHIRKGTYSIFFELQLEGKYFFSLGKDQQLEEITKFVEKAYSDAQKMRVKEK